jgi:hypothetical protein
MLKIGVDSAEADHQRVRFLLSTRANSYVTGSQLFLIWQPGGPPAPLVTDTRRDWSRFQSMEAPQVSARIEGDWYILFQWNGKSPPL